MNRLSYRLAAAVAAGLVVSLAACGTAGTTLPVAASPATNGLANQTATQVERAASRRLHVREERPRHGNLQYRPQDREIRFALRGRRGSAEQMLAPFSLTSLASELTAEESAHGGAGTVTQSALAGKKVAVVSYPDGSKLYVASTGTAYPLRFDDTGAAGSRVFSEYGAAFHITAPPNPV